MRRTQKAELPLKLRKSACPPQPIIIGRPLEKHVMFGQTSYWKLRTSNLVQWSAIDAIVGDSVAKKKPGTEKDPEGILYRSAGTDDKDHATGSRKCPLSKKDPKTRSKWGLFSYNSTIARSHTIFWTSQLDVYAAIINEACKKQTTRDGPPTNVKGA